jgi:hypothetical protein
MVVNRPEHNDATLDPDRPDINPASGEERPGAAHRAAAKHEQLAAEPAADISEQIADQAAADADTAPEAEPVTETSPSVFASSTPDREFAGNDRSAEQPRVSKASSILLPAVTGAVAAALVVGAAWSVLLPSATLLNGTAPPAASAPMDRSALDALVARVATVEARSAAAPAAAPSPDPAIGRRIDALEQSVASLRDDLAAARGQSEQLAAALNALKAAPAEPSASAPAAAAPASSDQSPDLAAINDRLAALERSAKSQDAAPATAEPVRAAAPLDDTPLRRAVAATLLDISVRQNEPYSVLLETAKPLASDPAALSSLDVFAISGVPTPAALSRDLVALLPKLLPAADGSAAAAGFVDRFQASAERLVRIQRSDAAAGIDRTAIIGRLTAAAQRNDIAELRRELSALAPADRAPAQAWIDKAAAREQALAASRQFAAAAIAALPKTSP